MKENNEFIVQTILVRMSSPRTQHHVTSMCHKHGGGLNLMQTTSYNLPVLKNMEESLSYMLKINSFSCFWERFEKRIGNK